MPIDLYKDLTGYEYEVQLGAIDRNYAKGNTDGNIHNNRGSGFEIATLGSVAFDTRAATLALTLNKGDDGLYSSTVKSPSDPTKLASLQLLGNGQIVYRLSDKKDTKGKKETSTSAFFAIRPLAGQAFAGDDILLTASVTVKSQKTGLFMSRPQLLTLRVADDKYLAVYDKKMLWRANLYIDEGDGDWNKKHPWNAPPNAKNLVMDSEGLEKPVAKVSPWWSDTWGCNEWNRYSRDMSFYAQGGAGVANGLDDLPVGDGKQVIAFPSFTPLGPIGEAGSAKDLISGKVAYSYPKHGLESNDGDAGSMDSPFDFKLKMLYQNALAGDQFNIQGKAFKRPRSQWPQLPQGSANDLDRFVDLSDYVAYVQTLTEKDMAAANKLNDSGPKGWQKYSAIQNFSTAGYSPSASDKGRAAGNRWWNYAYAPTDPGDKNETTSFIPSLGLLYHLKNGKCEVPNTGTIEAQADALLSKHWLIEVGTDCLGFARRAAGYSGTKYTWFSEQQTGEAWTEKESGAGSLNIWDVMTKARANTRIYPNATSTTIFLFSDRDIAQILGAPGKYAAQYQALSRIVPGDVVVWDGHSHIAVVSSVTSDANGKITGIGLIESTYGLHDKEVDKIPYIQSVIKSRALQESYTKAWGGSAYAILRLNTPE